MDPTNITQPRQNELTLEVTSLLREMHGDIKALRVQGEYQNDSIKELRDRLAKNEARADHVIDDHSARLTRLERATARTAGLIVGAGAIAGAIAGYLLDHLSK